MGFSALGAVIGTPKDRGVQGRRERSPSGSRGAAGKCLLAVKFVAALRGRWPEMEECCCCCESTPGRDRCPRCGQTGMAVKKITVKTPMPLVRHQQKDENKRAGICLEQ
ncbi:MAG TPA: hypothetical protein DEA73_09470, partial [Peptococcaceae bacterium]|nr:hypothetical protein [Peptococcaceae bacterium]